VLVGERKLLAKQDRHVLELQVEQLGYVEAQISQARVDAFA
jgi:hypothetical protein